MPRPVIFGDYQRAGDQAGDQIHDRFGIDGVAAADLLNRLERAASGEHGHAREQPLLGRIQQFVRPVDGGA